MQHLLDIGCMDGDLRDRTAKSRVRLSHHTVVTILVVLKGSASAACRHCVCFDSWGKKAFPIHRGARKVTV